MFEVEFKKDTTTAHEKNMTSIVDAVNKSMRDPLLPITSSEYAALIAAKIKLSIVESMYHSTVSVFDYEKVLAALFGAKKDGGGDA